MKDITTTKTTTCYKQKAQRTICLVLISVFFLLNLIGTLCYASNQQSALPDIFRSEDLLWEIKLGTHQYTIPKIDKGQMYIGTNDMALKHPAVKRTGGGIFMALDKATGEMIWQMPIPRYMKGTTPPYHFNQWKCGVCSRPALEGNRLYIVGPRGDILCLDRNGQADGNNGPDRKETEYMGIPKDSPYQLTKADGDIIWQFNMITKIGAVPHDVCGNSPLILGDFVYASSSNGQDDRHKFVANPLAPSLIVLDKYTGKLVATDGELIGKRMFHGHWSSPVAAEVNGQEIILFGGGDGVLYAFEPYAPSNTKNKVQTLKKIWQYDCNPVDYRRRNGRDIPYARHSNKSPDGPSEIIATPIVDKGRIYVTIGQSPVHGKGKGLLSCIDAATGQKIWESRRLDRSILTLEIHDGLLYAPDLTGRLHCFNAETGQHYWQHELEGGVWCASPVVLDGKVYISNEKKLMWVLKAGREKEVISRSLLKSIAITPVVHDDVFYLPTQRRLFAIKLNAR
ncbi:MAG: PQQ-binding-like beta-propeller repeat protein [Planctomycetes bacterium]|nr:PQQ-binding-like beta-propeller repeat protein [Planctomycetota bacterium]